MTTEANQRRAVIAAARGWVGTPWHHAGRVKGAGVDCAQIICAAYEEAQLIEHIDPRYARQWGLHRDRELFIEWIEKMGGRETVAADAKPADIVTFKFGRTFFHGAILTAPDTVIHADLDMGVIEEPIAQNEQLRLRIADNRARYFTLW